MLFVVITVIIVLLCYVRLSHKKRAHPIDNDIYETISNTNELSNMTNMHDVHDAIMPPSDDSTTAAKTKVERDKPDNAQPIEPTIKMQSPPHHDSENKYAYGFVNQPKSDDAP